MNPSESPNTKMTEDEIDALLTRFFAEEVPTGLPASSAQPPRPRVELPPGMTARRPRPSRFSGIAIGIGASALLIVAVVIGRPTSPTEPLAANSVPAENSNRTPVAYPPVEDPPRLLERRTLLTEDGPVEERTHLRYVRVPVEDPRTGRTVEVMIPELQIELFPSEPPGPSVDRLPE